MRKTIDFVLALILIALMLCSCATNECTLDVDGHGKRFELIEADSQYSVYVDMDTGVEYVKFNTGAAAIIDSYGNPYIYPAFDAREDKP